jgi:hypothetical protein
VSALSSTPLPNPRATSVSAGPLRTRAVIAHGDRVIAAGRRLGRVCTLGVDEHPFQHAGRPAHEDGHDVRRHRPRRVDQYGPWPSRAGGAHLDRLVPDRLDRLWHSIGCTRTQNPKPATSVRSVEPLSLGGYSED